MTLTLFRTADDTRKLFKALTQIKTVENIFPTGDINVYSPSFMIDYDADLIHCNYLYCDTTGLYYFVSPPVLIDGRRMELNCTCDYLMSFANDILNCNATVIRRENYRGETGATNVPDTKLPVDPKRFFYDGKKAAVLNANEGLNYFVAINGG